jgi:hypothetical protein
MEKVLLLLLFRIKVLILLLINYFIITIIIFNSVKFNTDGSLS